MSTSHDPLPAHAGLPRALKTLAAWALVALAWAAPARADFAADSARLEGELAGRLEALALWCEESHLLAERNRVYEALLLVAPDHTPAHEALGHREQKDGSWVVPSRVKQVHDDADAASALRAEVLERKRAAIAPYRDAVLPLLDAGDGVPDGAARHAYDVVLAVVPEDPEVRGRTGEAIYGNAWVLVETARAYERRPELRRLIAEAVAHAGSPEVLEVVEPLEAFGVEWTANARTPEVRVFGTGLPEETLRAAQAAHAAGEVCRNLFRSKKRLPKDYTVYLLARKAEVEPLLAGLDLQPEERQFMAQLVGSGIPRTANTAQWADSYERRLDGVVRHTLGQYLVAEFKVTTDQAWAWEGIGLYLTRELVGSRLTWYIARQQESTTQKNLRADLLVAETNWINAAYQLLRDEERAPDFARVMRLDANRMGVEGMLASYALCAYLLEGRPDELPELLHRAGRGEDPATAVPAALGIELEDLRPHLVRWLSERRRPEYYAP